MTKFGNYRRYLVNFSYQTCVVDRQVSLVDSIQRLVGFLVILEVLLMRAEACYLVKLAAVTGDFPLA